MADEYKTTPPVRCRRCSANEDQSATPGPRLQLVHRRERLTVHNEFELLRLDVSPARGDRPTVTVHEYQANAEDEETGDVWTLTCPLHGDLDLAVRPAPPF